MSDNIAASAKVLFTREQIEERAAELGKQISDDYAGESLYLIGTLRGAVVWMADLMKNITNDTEIDFIVASSYGSGTTSTGLVSIKKDLEGDIYGKNVLIIEDIVDTGTTLKYLKEHLADRNTEEYQDMYPAGQAVAGWTVDIEADYVGFSIDDSVHRLRSGL